MSIFNFLSGKAGAANGITDKATAFIGDQFIFWEKYFPLVKTVSAIFSLIFLAIIIYIVLRLNLFRKTAIRLIEKYTLNDVSERRVIKAWKQIEKRMMSKKEAEIKLAIIECDRVMDEILKVAGYRGETMAERLKKVNSAQLANIEEIWRAHKVRNRIVHEESFNLSQQTAENLVNEYKKAFQEFGLLRE